MIKLSLSKRKFYSVSLVLLLTIFSNIIIANTSEYKQLLFIISIFSIIQLAFGLCLLKYIGSSVFSIAGLFIIFSEVFHFGQAYLNVFFPNYKYMTINFIMSSSTENYKAVIFSYNVIAVIIMTILLTYNSDFRTVSSKQLLSIKDKLAKKIGWIILTISLPMETLYFIKQISLSQISSGYGSIYEGGFSGIFVQIASFAILGFSMLIVSYSKEHPKIAKCIWIFSITYYGFSMISGSRIYAVISIIILLYIYVNYINKITPIKMIGFVCLGMFFLSLLQSIMIVRQNGILNWSNIINRSLTSNNVILGALDEFGGTIYTVAVAIKEIPNQISYNFGLSYLYSLLTVGVNIGGILNYVNDNIEFTKMFTTKYTFGGSYIGELYYNFGWFGIVFSIFVGLLVAKCTSFMEANKNNKDCLSFSMSIMMMYSILIWTRSYCNILIRNIIWPIIIITALSKLLRRQQ